MLFDFKYLISWSYEVCASAQAHAPGADCETPAAQDSFPIKDGAFDENLQNILRLRSCFSFL